MLSHRAYSSSRQYEQELKLDKRGYVRIQRPKSRKYAPIFGHGGPPNVPAIAAFLKSLDLQRYQFSVLSDAEVAYMSQLCQSSLHQRYESLVARTNYYIGPFITPPGEWSPTAAGLNRRTKKFEVFWRFIDHTDTVVIGSLPRLVLGVESTVSITNLNFACPTERRVSSKDWKDFLAQFGFSQANTERMYQTQRRAEKTVTYYRAEDRRYITVTFSINKSVTPFLLTSPLTHQMTWMDAHEIWCLYPTQLKERVTFALVERPGIDVGRATRQGWKVYLNNFSYPAPCGAACPSIIRVSYKGQGKGVARLRWNTHNYEAVESACPYRRCRFEDEIVYFRSGLKTCLNKRCPFHDADLTTHPSLRGVPSMALFC